jgi:hypothetical protein
LSILFIYYIFLFGTCNIVEFLYDEIIQDMIMKGSVVTASPSSCRKNDLSILREVSICPVPFSVAREIIEKHHYLHSGPGGTMLSLGILANGRLMGALTLGVGPFNGHCLVRGARREDCITLTRLCLSDELPSNSESRVLGMTLRSLRRNTSLKFILSYAAPDAGHQGIIYQATNWLYTGPSTPMPLYDLGDGVGRHSRTLAQILGSHSIKHFANSGVPMKLIPQGIKYRYIYFLDPQWKPRLGVPILPYPKKGKNDGDN